MADMDTAALVRRAVEEIWNRGELAVADVLFASDYINHGGLIPDLVRGPEAIKISVAFYRTAFPDLQITIDELTAKRDAVLLRWTAHSRTPQSTLMGIFVSRIAGGQIAESWAQWDQVGALERLASVTRTHRQGTHTARSIR
jgi:predicted SnoaL-like aldol condensation-catalyzing enzyme